MTDWLWGLAAIPAYPIVRKVALQLYDDVYRRIMVARHDKLVLDREHQQIQLDAIRHLPPDANGRQGTTWDGTHYRDLDSRAVFTQIENRYFDPLSERINALEKMLIAARGTSSGQPVEQMIEGAIDQQVWWPERIHLLDKLKQNPPSINSIIVGQARDGALITRSLHRLMHTLIVGVTGQGKTVWLSCLLAGIALAPESVDVLAIDINGSGFNVLADWEQMRYPVARNTDQAVALLGETKKEIRRRMELYEEQPLATDLPSYNQLGGSEALTPWLVAVDEGTNLLAHKGIADPLRECVQCGRQYGVYVIATGQSAHHNVINTQTRDNFVSRLCFWTSPTSTRVVLGENPPHEIDRQAGRCWAQLDGGVDIVEVQGPYIERERLYDLLKKGRPKFRMPETDTIRQRIIDTWEEQESPTITSVTEALFNVRGGQKWEQIKEIAQQEGLIL